MKHKPNNPEQSLIMSVVAFTTATPVPLTGKWIIPNSRSAVPARPQPCVCMQVNNHNPRRFNRRSNASRRGSRERQNLRKTDLSKRADNGMGSVDNVRRGNEDLYLATNQDKEMFSDSVFEKDGSAINSSGENVGVSGSPDVSNRSFNSSRYSEQRRQQRRPESEVQDLTGFQRNQRSIRNQAAAKAAFSAVDKLFDSLQSNNVSTTANMHGDYSTGQNKMSDEGEIDKAENSHQRSPSMDKATWLENVRARAATSSMSGTPHRLSNQGDDGAIDFDVDAYESDQWSKPQSGSEKAESGAGTGRVRNSVSPKQFKRNNDVTGIIQRSLSDDDDDLPYLNPTRFTDSAYENLMRIARMGPVVQTNHDTRRNLNRNGRDRPSRSRYSSAGFPNKVENTEEDTSQQASGNPISNKSRAVDSNSTSSLLGLTKQIISNQSDFGGGDVMDNDYEESDKDVERTIHITSGRGKNGTRRQFPSVRRFGGQVRRILNRPAAWRPLGEEEVDYVTTDNRSLTGDSSGGTRQPRFLESDCVACIGSGLETCKLCIGEGWLTPVKAEQRKDIDDAVLRLIDEVWSLPNLVINSQGEAQCVRCSGVGKEFCRECKGSGSSTVKGFDPSEKHRVFDIFNEHGDGPSLDDIDFEWDGEDNEPVDEDEEEGEDERDMETFRLYQGSPEKFDFGLSKANGYTKEPEIDRLDEEDEFDDDLDVEDESAELLATLEAMDLQDMEETESTLDQRLGIRKKPLSEYGLDDDDDDDDNGDNDEGVNDAVVDGDDIDITGLDNVAGDDMDDIMFVDEEISDEEGDGFEEGAIYDGVDSNDDEPIAGREYY